jgi:chromosome segregation ATPase
MASIQATVHAQLQAFKSALEQANQHIVEVESLMDNLDHEFDSFSAHLQSETEQHLGRLHTLTTSCHSLDGELTQAFTELGEALTAAEDMALPCVEETVKKVAELQHENDGLVHKIDEADHSVEQLVQEVGHFAEDTSHKVNDAAHHIVETGHQTANKFGNELVHHVTELHQKVEHTFHTFEQEANNHLHDLEQHVGSYSHHVAEQAHHFAEHAQNAGNAAKDKLVASVSELEHGVMGHLGDLGQNIQHFHDDFMKLSEFITGLSTEGIEMVGELGEAIGTVNVGLNGVVKTVTNVKEILDEIGL